MYKVINLDDPNELAEFIARHKTIKGRALANRLGITGKGATAKANALSNYAWNKRTANQCRLGGDIMTALRYEKICDRIYKEDITDDIRW